MAAFTLNQRVSLATRQLTPVVLSGDEGVVSRIYSREEHVLQAYEVIFTTHDMSAREEFFLFETELAAL